MVDDQNDTKRQMLAYLKYVTKSVLTFLGMVLTNAAIDLMQSGKPWPEQPADWVRWAVSVFLISWIVYRVPNGPKPVRASLTKAVEPTTPTPAGEQ